MSAPSTASPPLRGLNAARVLGMALGEASGAPGIPTAEELGALLPEYDVQAVIGRGGMGAVYRAVQRNLARAVAIKVMPVEMGDTPGFADRFRQEAMTTAGLAHPDIVAVHDTGETVAGHLYYVMDLVDGEDLAVRMSRGRLPVEECVALLATVCGAVEAAHSRGIVHRDIKPSNILLNKDGKPKLADFGLALLTEKHLAYSRLTLGGTTLGTLEYAAPEQLAGTGATVASDQYSLGVLAYELLTGELPRGVFEPPSARNAEVDPAFDGVVLRALQSDPARRYESVAAFRAAILHAADRRTQQERRAAEARGKLRRRTRLAIVAAGVAVLTIGLAVFAWRQSQRAEAGESAAAAGRDAAQLTRAEAEKLVEFMLSELQGRLYEVNRIDVLEQVVARVDAYYKNVPAAEQQDDHFLLRKAEFIELRGALLGKQGRAEEELALYRTAQAIRGELLARHPEDHVFRIPYADGQMALAQALSFRKDYAGAVAAYDELLAAHDGPDADQIQVVLMSRALRVELLFETGSRDDAKQQAEAQLQQIEALLAVPEFGQEFAFQNVKAILLRALAAEAARAGDWKKAADFSQRRAELYRLSLPSGARHGYREGMFAEAAVTCADHQHQAGEAPAAELHAVAGYAAYDRLARDPQSGSEYRGLADRAAAIWAGIRRTRQFPDTRSILDSEARNWRERYDAAASETEREATAFAAVLKSPDDPAVQYEWVMASEVAGRHVETEQGVAAAIAFYQNQIEKLEPLWQAAPPDSWWNLSLSATLNRQGEIHERLREWPKAEPIFRRALDQRLRLLRAHRGEATREPRNVVSSAQRLARAIVALQRPAEALAVIRPLLDELKDIPSDRTLEWRANLGRTVAEVLPSQAPDAAKELTAAARAFLLAPGEEKMSAAEKQSLALLEQAAP